MSELKYWLALRPPTTCQLTVFGPYTQRDGNDRRDAMLHSFRSVDWVSTVFRAHNSEQAALRADSFMPKTG